MSSKGIIQYLICSFPQRYTHLLGQCDDLRQEVDFQLALIAFACLGAVSLDGKDAARHTQVPLLNLIVKLDLLFRQLSGLYYYFLVTLGQISSYIKVCNLIISDIFFP